MEKRLDQQNDKLGWWGEIWGSHDKPLETNSLLLDGGEEREGRRGKGENKIYCNMAVLNACFKGGLVNLQYVHPLSECQKHGQTARRKSILANLIKI